MKIKRNFLKEILSMYTSEAEQQQIERKKRFLF